MLVVLLPPPPFFLLQESAIADLTNTVRSLETQRTNTLDADLASSSQSQISRLATQLSEQEAASAGLTSTTDGQRLGRTGPQYRERSIRSTSCRYVYDTFSANTKVRSQ
jgi:hypothetical protein